MQPRGKNTAHRFHALTPDRQDCLNWSNGQNRGHSIFARDTHTFTEPWAVSNFSGGVTSQVPFKGKYFVVLISLAVITKLNPCLGIYTRAAIIYTATLSRALDPIDESS